MGGGGGGYIVFCVNANDISINLTERHIKKIVEI